MQHLDEGTIHAWLDGALAPNEASAADAHVQTCEQCSRAVAEARGLIAASSRILGALDDVPALQDPSRIPSIAAHRRGTWWRRTGVGYAAAATVLLAAGTTLVLRSVSPDVALDRAEVTFADTAAAAPASPAVAVEAARGTDGALQRARRAANERATVNEGAANANRSVTRQAKKEEEQLAVDKVVQLPGPPPRVATPAAPPPNVRQEQRKSMADAGADIAGASGGVVQGRVLDASTGVPVAGAIVTVDSARKVTRTDSAGKFELQQVPLGQQTVSVRALGFQAAQHPVVVPSDSVQLGFALQKSQQLLQGVVATGAAGSRAQDAQVQRARRDRAANAAESMLADSTRAKTAAIAGCYVIRVTGGNVDADRARIEAIPRRVQLGVSPLEGDTGEVRRALTLDGQGRAESWSLSGDALVLVWRDQSGRSVARFVRSGASWTGAVIGQASVALVMEPCTSR